VPFEMSARVFVGVMLEEMDYEGALGVRKSILHNNEILDIENALNAYGLLA